MCYDGRCSSPILAGGSVFPLRKGKDVTINKGIVLEVFTDQNYVMKGSAAASATPTSSGGSSTVVISSDIPGADIGIDGVFVENTPSTRPLTAGNHKIKVSDGSKVWERTLNVEGGGTINVKCKDLQQVTDLVTPDDLRLGGYNKLGNQNNYV